MVSHNQLIGFTVFFTAPSDPTNGPHGEGFDPSKVIF